MTALDVFGWQADETGCGTYRVALPMQGLAELGHRTAASMRMPNSVRDNVDTVIVGQRVCKPDPTVMWQHLAKQGRRLVFEIDDDLWNVDASSPTAHRFFANPEVRANLERNIRVAHAVTVTTEPLAERVSTWNSNVHVVPNAVPDWLVEHEPARRDDGVLTIGWGGSATHQMDFAQAASELRRFFTRNSDCELHCIGVDYASWMRVPPAQTRATPWVPCVDDFLRAIDYHVGIAPLRPHLFNQAKSALKALEVGALGIPVVASAVRPYEGYVRHGETGFLVHRDHEWAKHLRVLVNDPDLRREMGAAAREQARGHTITATAPLWQKAILG
ncbi:glycosyl transferase family 1 [Streptomyces sp. Amel2xB2]|uniref:glycosyltransferase n=1 Tax=Streptomyces sp. Amel2xB2 TaxID=1305829 RepID=UPI000DBA816D|nr:glycosyltransferase [Streptomyces sp. Amel2xB2]RAJ70297.1 glycosyl transferase family 1 [Streptomyces sp. Amel2xB2]